MIEVNKFSTALNNQVDAIEYKYVLFLAGVCIYVQGFSIEISQGSVHDGVYSYQFYYTIKVSLGL